MKNVIIVILAYLLSAPTLFVVGRQLNPRAPLEGHVHSSPFGTGSRYKYSPNLRREPAVKPLTPVRPQLEDLASRCDPVVESWNAGYESQPAPPNAIATDQAIDKFGNIYVVGQCDRDFLVVKYDRLGDILWVKRYNGPDWSTDAALAVAVDSLGCAYVTGWTMGDDYDISTVKYSPDGFQLWADTYRGTPLNSWDGPTSVTVDRSGSIVVTGYTGYDTSSSFLTIKYSSMGVRQWVAHYGGPIGSVNIAEAAAVDDSGNFCITGYGGFVSSPFEYVTVKYNPAGVLQWEARLAGETGEESHATHIEIDRSGNIVVAGWLDSPAASADIVTAEYSPNGEMLWRARYDDAFHADDEPAGIALDGRGNVLVTGSTYRIGIGSNFVTMKYDSIGAALWTAVYSGSDTVPTPYTKATGIIADSSGNVYVTGYSTPPWGTPDYTTLKYTPTGERMWIARYDGPSMDGDWTSAASMNPEGSLVVSGSSYGLATAFDFAIVTYDTAGTERWNARYDGPGDAHDVAAGMVVDSLGNSYVLCTSFEASTGNDLVTMKYDSTGTMQWIARYNNADDRASAIVIDSAGDIIVTGSAVHGFSVGASFVTVKYNNAGSELWRASYGSPGSLDDYATALAVDRSGNCYVTGYSRESGTQEDYLTLKYDASGAQQWVARYNGPGNFQDMAIAVGVDSSGNAFVTGTSRGASTSSDIATIKYNPAGGVEWISRYNGAANAGDMATGLAVDESGNTYISGHSTVSSSDYVTIKYDPTGVQQWAATYNGPGNSSDYSRAIVIDQLGNVFVTGSSIGAGTDEDYATIKYDPFGSVEWIARYDGSDHLADVATNIAIDHDGSVYVAGMSLDGNTDFDFVSLKYSGSGEPLWQEMFRGIANSADRTAGVTVGALGKIWVTGTSDIAGAQKIRTVLYTEVDTKYAFKEKWNLVSLPRHTPDASKAGLFPSSSSPLYSFEGSYVQRDSLEIGRGYWLKFPVEACVTIEGEEVEEDSVTLTEGWNLIGTIARATPTSLIDADPPSMILSQFFGYDKQYVETSDLLPGRGYWVKASMPGTIYLGSHDDGSDLRKIRTLRTSELPPSPPSSTDEDVDVQMPARSALMQNHPNPFNPSTTIRYELPEESHVVPKIFNILGQEVGTLVDQHQDAGFKSVRFDAHALPSGLYYYRLQAGRFVDVKKMLLLR